MSDPDHIRLLKAVASHFFGEPNQRLSKKGELRFGTHGSLSVDLEKGVWYDHESNIGGGPLDLIRREAGVSEPREAYAWAEREGYWINGRARDFANGAACGGHRSKLRGEPTATYDYADEGGALLLQVVRYAPKTFRQRRPDGKGGWIWNIEGERRVPYRLPELIEALGNDRTVFIVEGEKDVDNVIKLGAPATCNLGGAGKWHVELNQYFGGAHVVVIADNDPQSKNKKTGALLFHNDGRPRFAGWDHAIEIAQHLSKVAESVRVIDLKKAWPQCPDKGDVSDWIAAGLTIARLNELVEQLPDWSPTDQAGAANGFSWRLRKHGEANAMDTRQWLLEGLLPATGTALISGQWGTFKTFCAFDIACAVMTGGQFIKYPVARKGGVFLIAVEGQSEVAIRITVAWEARGGSGRAPFSWVEQAPQLLDPHASDILIAMVRHAAAEMQRDFGLPIALVIIDTAPRAAGYQKAGDENDAALAKKIMGALSAASAATGALFVAVAHFGKHVETGTRGSSSFEDDADVVLALLGERGANGAITNTRLSVRKQRAGASGQEFPFRTKTVDFGRDSTLVLDWLDEDQAAASTTAAPTKWAKSLRLLRQVLMTMLADVGKDIRPWADGPMVRAVDLEVARAEFYKSYPAAEAADAKSKAEARRKAFGRAIREAEQRGLIKSREIDGVTLVWLVSPAVAPGPSLP
jgi:hypothetical protein